MTPDFIQQAIFSFGEAMNLVKIPTTEEEYKKWVTPYPDKTITKTWVEVKSKSDALETDWNAKKYQRDRQPEYPQIGDQLDMLYHAIDAGKVDKTSDFYKALKAVKDKHPKG